MPKDSNIPIKGRVIQVLGGTKFKVESSEDPNHLILATISGKMRKHKIRIVLHDEVTVEVSPYDTTKGIITHRK